MQPKEKRMYKLIWNNTIESCMSDAQYKQMTTVISAFGEKSFRYSSEKNIFSRLENNTRCERYN